MPEPGTASGAIDITASPTQNLRWIAKSLQKSVRDITAVILDRPRHTELVQEIRDAGTTPAANPGWATVGFQPHLVPMNRGILATGHVRPTRAITNAELGELYREAYAEMIADLRARVDAGAAPR